MSIRLTILVATIILSGTVSDCQAVAQSTKHSHKTQDQQLSVYGSKTKLYITRLHDAISVVTQQTMKLKENPNLFKDKMWKQRTNSQLVEILRSGDKLAHIHPVPAIISKINADFKDMAVVAQSGARKYLRGEERQDIDTMLAGFKELVGVGLSIENVSAKIYSGH